jgi:hypothetical protein
VRDQANRLWRWLFDHRWIQHPGVTIGPPAAFPSLRVQLTQALTCRTIAAAGDRAPLVRLLASQPRIGVRDELVEVRAAQLVPADPMVVTQPVPDGTTFTPIHPASAAPEHWIADGDNHCLAAELGSNNRHQPAQQSAWLSGRGGHQFTYRPSNQPACSSVARASSAVR